MDTICKQLQTDIKKNNLKLIIDTILKHEPLSRADIVRLTKISKPTVSSLIEDLIKRNIVTEIGIGKSKGGRKPILIKFNSTKKLILAVDIGREDLTIAVSDLKGNINSRSNYSFDRNYSLQERLIITKQKIMDLVSETNINMDSIFKITCIAPGIYVEKGRELKWNPASNKSENYDIKTFFKEEFKIDSIINHSTKLSLLGEKVAGKAKDYNNVVYIDFAYGLGCSIMIDGNIYFGKNNSAGEFGYFYSNTKEFKKFEVVPYEFGALEKIISGYALQTKAIKAIRNNKKSLILDLAQGNPNNITGKLIFHAAMMNDPLAVSILKESFLHFNMALANIINLLTPELVIFGGGFSNAGEYLLNLIKNDIKDKVLFLPRLEISDLKKDASIIGAIHYLVDNIDYLNDFSFN